MCSLIATKIFPLFKVREIQQEVYVKPEAVEQKETKQATAVDLISRLNNFRSSTDSGSMKGNYLVTSSQEICCG